MTKNIIEKIFKDADVINDVKFLKNLDFFKNFGDKQLNRVTQIIYKKNYMKGEVLYNCGEEAKMFFILKYGKTELDCAGKNISVQSGKFINSDNISTHQFYTAQARASEDSFVYIVYKQEFEELFAKRTINFDTLKKLFEKVRNVFKKQSRN
ncbi:MAG: cyclic nucleotide-binding domain-containing protein [Endomicrobiaceae bacterium]|jgi:signal-transduction protein with cAMP-binding, CBS, and nucleotidyltransferase domain|nr:cyclic nucleotide-binding domain-containing protein [Endomicrobiaceae bacterium]MDD3729721.1 cyclic nucleotide-binding domain-containing protein [Endomicrobiaceae bacterium]MDD4165532.1 cyclic nucleotide-binding domain-containing protein [Endomicrobiaceae bacterium]